MTASGLKRLYERNSPGGRFFDRRTMRFFGDTMRNYGVRDGGKIKTLTRNGVEEVAVWQLYRKRPVKSNAHGHCRYFSKENGQEIFTSGGVDV
jgi:hypothetical protein